MAEVALITGMSGAGRSAVANVLEDLGWYVVDNLPTPLVGTIVELAAKPGSDIERLALVAGREHDEILTRVGELRAEKSGIRAGASAAAYWSRSACRVASALPLADPEMCARTRVTVTQTLVNGPAGAAQVGGSLRVTVTGPAVSPPDPVVVPPPPPLPPPQAENRTRHGTRITTR